MLLFRKQHSNFFLFISQVFLDYKMDAFVNWGQVHFSELYNIPLCRICDLPFFSQKGIIILRTTWHHLPLKCFLREHLVALMFWGTPISLPLLAWYSPISAWNSLSTCTWFESRKRISFIWPPRYGCMTFALKRELTSKPESVSLRPCESALCLSFFRLSCFSPSVWALSLALRA